MIIWTKANRVSKGLMDLSPNLHAVASSNNRFTITLFNSFSRWFLFLRHLRDPYQAVITTRWVSSQEKDGF